RASPRYRVRSSSARRRRGTSNRLTSSRSSAATIVNYGLTGNADRYGLHCELAVGVGHVECDRESSFRGKGCRVTRACSGRWSSSAPPRNRVGSRTTCRSSSTCTRLACSCSSAATIIDNWLTSDDNGDGLYRELAVSISDV